MTQRSQQKVINKKYTQKMTKIVSFFRCNKLKFEASIKVNKSRVYRSSKLQILMIHRFRRTIVLCNPGHFHRRSNVLNACGVLSARFQCILIDLRIKVNWNRLFFDWFRHVMKLCCAVKLPLKTFYFWPMLGLMAKNTNASIRSVLYSNFVILLHRHHRRRRRFRLGDFESHSKYVSGLIVE